MAPKNTISRKNTVAKVFKLSEIILKSISENFNVVIYSSDDDEIKRSLLFLQKKFSSHFLNIFSTPDYLDNKYFHFLLNKYLRELNTKIFLEEDWEVALHYLKDIGQSFEKVTFQYRHPSKAVGLGNIDVVEPHQKRLKKPPSEDFLQKFVHVLLPCLTNVSSLTMHASTGFTDETVKMICSTCKELKDLTFAGRRSITEEGLKSLCPDDQCNKLNLKSLNLPSIRHFPEPPAVWENGIIHLLQKMPSLEEIGYRHLARILHRLHVGDLLNNSLSSVRKYNLTSMDIYDSTFRDDTDAFARTLAIVAEVCPALKKLSVRYVTENEHLVSVTKFPNLVDVSLIFRKRDDVSLDLEEVLRVSGKQLKVLHLRYTRVSVASLLRSCPRLVSLTLSWIEFTDFQDHPNLKPLWNLKHLCLDWFDTSNPNTEKSFQLLLKSCPNLEKLEFYWGWFEIDQKLKGILKPFKNYCERTECLQSLTFDGCYNLDPGLLQHIVSTCRSLKTLVVNMCDTVGMREIEALQNIVKASPTIEANIKFSCNRERGDAIGNAEDVTDHVYFVSNQPYEETDEENYDTDDAP